MPIRMSGLVSGMDTESIVKELMSAQRLKSTKIEKNITKLEWKQEKWKDMNSKIYSFYTGALSKAKLQSSYNTKKVTSSDETKVALNASGSVPEGTQTIKVKAVASSQFVTGSKLATTASVSDTTKLVDLGMASSVGSSISIKAGEKQVALNITADTTIGDFTNALQEAGLNASFDSGQKRFFISSKASGYENAFSMTASSSNVDLTKLGLSEIQKTGPDANGAVTVSAGSNVSLIKPSDAIIVYNGAEMQSASNTITANGLTITVKGVTTADEVVNVNVTKDNQSVYDMVKNFVKSYNELLKGMNEAYGAESSKGYEPLTDDEKEAMSEEQEKKWEDKIKASLLRRDGTLNSVISSMRSTMSGSVTVNGKSYSLASFGITAPDYTEKGLLHIKGDSDDTITSAQENELMKAVSEDPDTVKAVITKLAGELYGSLTEQMKSTSLSSALTIYNDKEMKSTLKGYKDDLSKLEERLQDMETRYYKQFTAMETMISKINSDSSSMASLLGLNTNS